MGAVLRDLAPVLMGHLSMLLLLRGCWSGHSGSLSWKVLVWLIMLTAAPELISTGRTETFPECMIWACSMKDH